MIFLFILILETQEFGTCQNYQYIYQQMDQTGLKALIIGATGAIGRELITELIASPKWSEINVIVRRQLPQWQLYDPVLQKKLKVIQVENMDELQNTEKWKFQDINTFFCLLGSRTKEGEALFTKVDYHYPVYGAEIAKKNNIPHYSLLTSVGADKSSMFLYIRVKGQVEEAIKSHKFLRTSIFRPGLLMNRDNDDRWIEKVAAYVPFLSKIQSRDLAK
ncbi:hypothetical protein pb186bvf_004037, partial [Paramecium bursaria]